VEAVAAFADLRRVILPNLDHSRAEPRWYCFGRTSPLPPSKLAKPFGVPPLGGKTLLSAPTA